MSDERFPDRHNPVIVEFAFGADLSTPVWTWPWVNPNEAEEFGAPHRATETALLSNDIRISRGRQDWASSSQPSSASTSWWNPKGHLSPNNPESPYYPHVKRGTPMRISVAAPESFLSIPSSSTPGTGAWTHDLPIFSNLTERFWVKVEITPNVDAAISARQWIASQWSAAGNERGWYIQHSSSTDTWTFGYSTTGADVNLVNFTEWGGRYRDHLTTVGFLFDSLTGSVSMFAGTSWDNIEFQESQTIPNTPMHDSSANLELGYAASPGPGVLVSPSRIWRFEMRDWTPTGDVVAEVDFRELPDGTTSWATYPNQREGDGTQPGTLGDVQVWSVQGPGVEVTNREVRYLGDVASWQVGWPNGDVETEGHPGNSVVSASALGPLSRLSRQDALRSSLYRHITRTYRETDPVAYWPLEEPFQYTEVLRNNARPVGFHSFWEFNGEPFPGSDNTLSGPLSYNDDRTAYFYAANLSDVQSGQNQWTASIFARVPQDGWVAIDQGETPGTVRLLGVRVLAGPPGQTAATNLTIAFDKANGLYMYADNENIGPLWSPIPSFPVAAYRALPAQWVQVSMAYNGSTVTANLRSLETGAEWTISRALNLTGVTVGRIGNQPYNTAGGNVSVPGNVRFGHMVLRYGSGPSSTGADLFTAAVGHVGEQPWQRFTRLSTEEGVPVTTYADSQISQPMGPQRPSEFLSLLDEARMVGNGNLGEDWEEPGLVFRSAGAIRGQLPQITLSGRSIPNELADNYSSILDDQNYSNRVTVDSESGGSRTVTTIPTGNPERLPVYPLQVSVNVEDDSQLAAQAQWRLTLGSWEDPRSPTITINLLEAPHLVSRVVGLREGDLICLDKLPSQHPRPVAAGAPADKHFFVIEGITERLGPSTWTISFACSPGEPWRHGTQVPFPL